MALLELWTWIVGVVGVLFFLLLGNSRAWWRRKVPPGSLGLPLIGESPFFLMSSVSKEPYAFTKARCAKYGTMFKTHLLGQPTIVITDPEDIKFVLQNEGKIFESSYPRSLEDVFGTYAILRQHGDMQKRLHGIIGRFTNSTKLKQYLMKDVENFIKDRISNWRGRVVYIQEECQRFTHSVVLKQLLGLSPGETSEKVLKAYRELIAGIISIPLMIPGTPYYKSMKARERLLQILREMVNERRQNPGAEHKDILQTLMEEKREDDPDELIYDNIIDFLGAGETTAPMIMTCAVKYLSDCPAAIEALREENLAIRKSKGDGEGLTWNDYLSLTFTQAVINETLRMANVSHGVNRKAKHDVEYKGYIIPKGWVIFPYFLMTHFDGKVYEDPLTFNPWRWQQKRIPTTSFIPFGGGIRVCAGQELARLEITMFLHYLVTNFRWEAQPDAVINYPTVRMKNKMPIVVKDILA